MHIREPDNNEYYLFKICTIVFITDRGIIFRCINLVKLILSYNARSMLQIVCYFTVKGAARTPSIHWEMLLSTESLTRRTQMCAVYICVLPVAASTTLATPSVPIRISATCAVVLSLKDTEFSTLIHAASLISVFSNQSFQNICCMYVTCCQRSKLS